MATVSPSWDCTLQLPRDPRSPGIGRATLRIVLDAHGLAPLVPTAELLAAELLTNAHLHTSGPYALRLRAAEDGRVRVGVWDSDPTVPKGFDDPGLFMPPDMAESGRGLHLVRVCADTWGAYRLCGDRGGKLLWAECQ
ncbi:ATP-binding protein [Streptomyces aurantiacus]|uniref:ATPase n=1 Tax=Streptomyces aurantiacus TaxID=47760 RepID=A0A7G1P7S9_9ACTN|nr:ATP-binding protein [Streptomyces aurantiacus]BCL29085.1 ATPase [Streptomyces aurantiacus]